jgi:hypothetical protein
VWHESILNKEKGKRRLGKRKKAPRKKERQDETQFTAKIGGKFKFGS